MRVEIDTRDLVELVKQFTNKLINEDDVLEDIEQMVTYAEDYDFKHEVEITKF